jgi:MFS family permease
MRPQTRPTPEDLSLLAAQATEQNGHAGSGKFDPHPWKKRLHDGRSPYGLNLEDRCETRESVVRVVRPGILTLRSGNPASRAGSDETIDYNELLAIGDTNMDTPQKLVGSSVPPPTWTRWNVLMLLSIAMFGNYYAYDAIAPLADTLQNLLGFSDTQLGTLNAIYSFPNIFMVLIGGIIVDRIGTRLSTLIFASICLVGVVLTAATSNFYVMAAGRLIFGLGAETMIVGISTALGQWFVGRTLGFAFALNLSLGRAGSFAADMSPTWAKSLYDQGWQPPLMLAAAMFAIALAGAVGYFAFEWLAARRYTLQRPVPPDKIDWGELWRFDLSFWYIVGLCVTFYSVIFPFRSTFAIKYFQHAHDLTLEAASTINSYVFFAAIFATPLFGLLVDFIGRRSQLMAGGTLLLMIVFPVLAYTKLSLWVATALIGIAFSLVPAVMWPSIPYLVRANQLGTAYGLMFMLQNAGLTALNLIVGALNDRYDAGVENPEGYLPMLWLFGILSAAGLVFAGLLFVRESGPNGHRLEHPLPKSKLEQP